MKKTHAFITVEPPKCFKTKLEFDFDNLIVEGGADGGVLCFYGVGDKPVKKGWLGLAEAIEENGVGDILVYDKESEELTVEAKDILTLRICGTLKYL